MRITYVSAKTSMQNIFIFLILTVIFISIPLTSYYFSYPPQYSFKSFCDWILFAYNDTFSNDKLIFWFLSLAPVCNFIGLIFSIYTRKSALNKLNSSLNLKSVDFLEGRIDYRFNQPQYNFSSGYNDIEKLKMAIETKVVRTRNSSYIAISQVVLEFTVLNGKIFKIANTFAHNPMKYIYKILDYTKYIPDFSYNINGPDDQYDEKIKKYLEKDFKSNFTIKQRSNMKILSIFLFLSCLLMMYVFMPSINDSWNSFPFIFLIFPLILFFCSIILDILIIKDEFLEKKYSNRGVNVR